MALITPHFTWNEVSRSATAAARDLDNSIPDALHSNAVRMADLMEQVRALLGVPIRVTSWYRSPALNTAIGGSPTSAHMKALAVDFIPIGMPLALAFDKLADSALAFDQLIDERTTSGSAWIHVGLPTGTAAPRRMALRARGGGGRDMTYARIAEG